MSIKKICLLLVSVLLLGVYGCKGAFKDGDKGKFPFVPKEYSASVSFIDVGLGECIYVEFPDKTNLLIDCGGESKEDEEIVKEYLENMSVNKIDRLVITHPDAEHIGGGAGIINNFTVGEVYAPDVKEANIHSFPTFSNLIKLIQEKQIPINTSLYSHFKGEGYSVAFLSPQLSGSVDYFNSTTSPTAEQVNNLSPVIYVDILGVRFVFTGDAYADEQKAVLDLYNSSFYKLNFSYFGIDVKLEEVDFYKVADGGNTGTVSTDFVSVLAPKNAVIITGDGKIPDSMVIGQIYNANKSHDLWRTDYSGTIAVCVETNGDYVIKTQKNN